MENFISMFGGNHSPLDLVLWGVLAGAGALVGYVYIGYPVVLAIFGLLFGRRQRLTQSTLYPVTLIIPAYNEAQVIRSKIGNSLAIDYPPELLEVVVASDGSDDGTNEIVQEFAERNISLRAFAPRAGKISVLNRTIPEANGEIVVLCDANVMFSPDAIKRLILHFNEPDVGAVTGDVRIQSEDAPFGEGEGFYYKYERFIQSRETMLGSTITVDGGMYAIRKELFRPLPKDTILDDFVIGMNVALAGRRVLYDPSAIATENATMKVQQEFRRKVRIVAGGFRELLRCQGVPGPGRVQLFWSYVSHKLLRWFVPWLLLVLLACNLVLVSRQEPGFGLIALLVAQVAFYACALIGCTRPDARWPGIIGIPFYFCMVNAAAWVGSVRGLTGVERVTWTKVSR